MILKLISSALLASLVALPSCLFGQQFEVPSNLERLPNFKLTYEVEMTGPERIRFKIVQVHSNGRESYYRYRLNEMGEPVLNQISTYDGEIFQWFYPESPIYASSDYKKAANHFSTNYFYSPLYQLASIIEGGKKDSSEYRSGRFWAENLHRDKTTGKNEYLVRQRGARLTEMEGGCLIKFDSGEEAKIVESNRIEVVEGVNLPEVSKLTMKISETRVFNIVTTVVRDESGFLAEDELEDGMFLVPKALASEFYDVDLDIKTRISRSGSDEAKK